VESTLTGKHVAVVTGAGSGIGRACCDELTARGYRVIGADRAFGVVAHDRWYRIAVDVTRPDHIARLHDEVASAVGRVDLLVTAAGVAGYSHDPGAGMDREEWDQCYSVNVIGVAAVIYAFVPLLAAAGGGAVVTIASISARRSSAVTSPAYAASKGAVVAMTRSFATSLAPQRTRVNCIAPGTVDTPMTASWPEETLAEIRASVPLGRLAASEEIARAVCFLGSAEASYLTGVTLDVNGGVFMTP
jgi:NAD(P)-dependent dehydrogenase (short-subunit alcohol dehydrogenase family)